MWRRCPSTSMAVWCLAVPQRPVAILPSIRPPRPASGEARSSSLGGGAMLRRGSTLSASLPYPLWRLRLVCAGAFFPDAPPVPCAKGGGGDDPERKQMHASGLELLASPRKQRLPESTAVLLLSSWHEHVEQHPRTMEQSGISRKFLLTLACKWYEVASLGASAFRLLFATQRPLPQDRATQGAAANQGGCSRA